MKRLAFAIVGSAALALVGCNNNNQDAVQNAELNQPERDLNEIANQAAMDAANEQAAAQANIENAQQEQNAAVDNAVNPQEADEQNVSGM
jgi:uncharacterized lipoprotein NlpE involved in copper resistance